MENYKEGDTVHIYSMHGSINVKGFFYSYQPWIGHDGNELNGTIDLYNIKGETHSVGDRNFISIGTNFLSMKISTCRIVLIEKNKEKKAEKCQPKYTLDNPNIDFGYAEEPYM